MRLDPSELEALVDGLTRRLAPRLIAELREQLRPAEDTPDLVGITELAERIGLSPGTIRARVKDDSLPAVRIGRRVLFSLPAVIQAMQDRADKSRLTGARR